MIRLPVLYKLPGLGVEGYDRGVDVLEYTLVGVEGEADFGDPVDPELGDREGVGVVEVGVDVLVAFALEEDGSYGHDVFVFDEGASGEDLEFRVVLGGLGWRG